jgi:hypothetical protein
MVIKNKEQIKYINIPINFYLTGGYSGKYNAQFFWEKIKLLIKYALDKEIMVLFFKYPKEFFYFSGIFLYSMLNVLLIGLFNKKILIRLPKSR